ncbi:alcohol dehydrogenase catalytic domain-containing protein [Tissierella sp. MSJ-40]|uniref:Alcohol dehydrogenase catalytic domain-containing protein n=1 Tax=Tissierella simiarum TaxID=2841534 RepID=A0ABS6E8E6_9FIRM|nr:alcohol dehydrogenase catalytic domain-containing protein [Tissierella simiarum]
MKALIFKDINQIELQEIERPILEKETDAIIRITMTTICGSDIHLYHGHMPTTPGYALGHEYVGIVEEVGGAVKSLKKGDRVIGPAAPFCGYCENCKNGHIAQCVNGGVHGSGKEFGNIPGTHAEFSRVPFADNNLIKVPENLKDEQVLFVGDVLSTGYFGAEKCRIQPGDNVVIFGAGPVGLCAVQAAKLFSPKNIILVGRKNQLRLDIGKKLGATHIIRTDKDDLFKSISEITKGKSADAAIEASGSEIALQQAVKCVGISGRVSLVGLYSKNIELPLPEIFMKNISIEMGLGYLGHMQRLLNMVESGQIDMTPLITHHMKLDDMVKAYDLFENNQNEVVKIAVTP